MAADMLPASVTERLRTASLLSAEARKRSRIPPKIGGSPEEVTARLRQASRLRELCLRLGELGRPIDRRVDRTGAGGRP